MIGRNFSAELEAAGLMGLPFSWSETGELFGREALTAAQNATLDAVIAAHVPELVLVADVKQEAQRRIVALTGVADLASCLIKQMNANMRANELNNILATGGTLTAEEQTEAAQLQAYAAAIKLIRAKSNEIEAMSPIPADFATNNAYWT